MVQVCVSVCECVCVCVYVSHLTSSRQLVNPFGKSVRGMCLHVCRHRSIYGPKRISGYICINGVCVCVCVCVQLTEHGRRW